MIALAEQAYEAASNDEERARACNRRCGGWDGMVELRMLWRPFKTAFDFRRFHRNVDAVKSNLANAYYSLWQVLKRVHRGRSA